MNQDLKYDVAITGGGLGGLALSIQLARLGHSVVLMEKETYPFHKVCGEYISLECWNFLESLGYPLSDLDLPVIRKLQISAPDGTRLERSLPLGGFGISRYTIDSGLMRLAKDAGVVVLENCKVNDISYDGDGFVAETSRGQIKAKLAAGSFGKRSNLDIKWKRPFALRKRGNLNNYIGVKYHIRYEFPRDMISLHNFAQGYCGISGIEDGKYCLCYLTTAKNLQKSGNSIHAMEKTILSRNPYLKDIFENAIFEWPEPVTIAKISFDRKSQVEQHVLMLGDAAGMIAPLCGNGMSMALHGSKIATKYIRGFLTGEYDRDAMEVLYTAEWRKEFAGRLRVGRFTQRLFGGVRITNLFIRAIKPFPKFITYLIRQTHGEPF